MKKMVLVSLLVLSLAACHQNPQPPQLRAKAVTNADNVCVLVQPEGDEQVVIVKISEVGNPQNTLEKYDINDIAATFDSCMPTYGYKFEKGHAYNFTVYLDSAEKRKKLIIPSSRIFSIGFAVRDNNGITEIFSDN
ncbi:hypothetical protein PU683_08200 [Kosakonia cowanii]|uniref:putative T6SS immunity periplasmic lipoprotein n=1 Tax=Kosakonia cowanii TaxID=208223 RepID=UPI0023F63452|nr:putative T6SS immunity periplasmic lipoprotein [Kosakonia cowanii]MDF7759510.1 hypothetical protein [Kosakonia cowanii]